MEEQLRALLLADAGVSAIVGNRVDWGSRTERAPLPAIVLNVVSDAEEYTQSGASGLRESRMQVDCYADSYPVSRQLSSAVRAALSAHKGGVFQGVFLAMARDMRAEGTNEATRPYRVSMDFEIYWSE